MKLRRRPREPEDELRLVAARQPDAIEERREADALLEHDRQASERSAKADLEAFALQDIDEGELARRNAEREQMIAGREAEAQRAADVVAALARRAGTLIPEVEKARTVERDAAIAEREPRRARLLAELEALDRADARDRQRAKLASVELDRLREKLDPDYQSFVMGLRRQGDEAARSIYKNYPSRRREAAAAGDPIAVAMERDNADFGRRQREAAARSWEELNGQGEPPRLGVNR